MLPFLRRRKTSSLASLGGNDAPVIDLPHLQVRHAEAMLIIITDRTGAQAIGEFAASSPSRIAASTGSLELRTADTRVYLVHSRTDDLPVHDPRRGWIIALPPHTRRSISEQLSDADYRPGDYELSQRLAVVIE